MFSFALWFLIGLGLIAFIFYVGVMLWQIISMTFDLLFDGMGQLILWAIIIIGIVVFFVI